MRLFPLISFLFIGLIFLFMLYSIILYKMTSPSSSLDWEVGQDKMPLIQLTESNPEKHIQIDNVRNFDWSKEDTQQWGSIDFPLSDLNGVKVVVSHFSPISELAHVFLIFSLQDGRELGLSIESRREKGEKFSLLGGLKAHYEIIYLIATTDDLLGLRKLRKEKVYSYPIKTTEENIQQLFVNLTNKIGELNTQPELYHLFFRNCTNQLVKQVNQLSDLKYSWFVQTFAPGNTGKALFKMGLIDTKAQSFKEAQQLYLVR